MPSKKAPILFATAFVIFFGFLTTATPLFAAGKERVLYSFGSETNDGVDPKASLIFDGAGNLYGTTSEGGDSGTGCGGYGCGTVFQLTRGANGKWTETVLHSFRDDGKDGHGPSDSLFFDAAGNLYGTTTWGGANGYGTVFQLTPSANGKWTESVLHSFNGKDGGYPRASLILDAAGNLYGTTQYGGAYVAYGTVFQLAPSANGKWTEKVLHSFDSNGKDGYGPDASLILDAAGNLYGTTPAGGAYGSNCNYGCGTVFELVRRANGKWTEKLLHSFSESGKDGYGPVPGLIFDPAGNLYGTTYGGGAYGPGSAFELRPGTNGKWKEKVLHSFDFGRGGCIPYGGLILDAAGNLYGTTVDCGSGLGTVFQLTPVAGGNWKGKVLHNFNGKDGGDPDASLILDGAGNLYGTSLGGGANGGGTVFEVTP